MRNLVPLASWFANPTLPRFPPHAAERREHERGWAASLSGVDHRAIIPYARTMKRFITLACIAVAILAFASVAQADTGSLSLVGPSSASITFQETTSVSTAACQTGGSGVCDWWPSWPTGSG